jgi:excisionase family DNA binding protein
MNDQTDFNDLISISEAARTRNVSHTAIQDLIRRGKLSSIKIGGRQFLKRSDVENFQPEPLGRPPKAKAETSKERKKKGTRSD